MALNRWGAVIPQKRKPVQVELPEGPCFAIPLTRGMVAYVDLADIGLIQDNVWFVKNDGDGRWYAYRSYRANGRKIQVTMHRVIMQARPGEIIDHISHNTLDNRRSVNLRRCNNQQNTWNARLYSSKKTSRLRGVSFIKTTGKFRAQIMVDGRKYNLGNFGDEKQAALAYDAAARKFFGAFANPNFPENEAA